MPQEPKKRHSRARQGKRRADIRLLAKKLIVCPNCKQSILPHTACKKCGFYKGVEVVKKKVKKKKEE
jgi:large subunit ribosomal protein L32